MTFTVLDGGVSERTETPLKPRNKGTSKYNQIGGSYHGRCKLNQYGLSALDCVYSGNRPGSQCLYFEYHVLSHNLSPSVLYLR